MRERMAKAIGTLAEEAIRQITDDSQDEATAVHNVIDGMLDEYDVDYDAALRAVAEIVNNR